MVVGPDPLMTPVLALAIASDECPQAPFITIGGRTQTYAETKAAVWETAAGLRALGIRPGDRVLILIPNREEALWAWLGAQAAGAIDAPASAEAPVGFIRYLLKDLQPAAVIGTAELLQRVHAAAPGSVELNILVGGSWEGRPMGDNVRHATFEELRKAGLAADRLSDELPSATSIGTVMYSSGTTGPSKGVMLSQGYLSTLAWVHTTLYGFGRGARIYGVQPLCHIDARSIVIDALHVRGHVALGDRFSASRYMSDVVAFDADFFLYVGTMIHLLFQQARETDPPLSRRRIGFGSATPAALHRDFEKRFDVELIEGYGMTEFGVIISQRAGETSPGHLGKPPPWLKVLVVDQEGLPVQSGVPGRLLARPQGPHLHMLGYWNKPEATVEAWQGLWFNTGDIVRERVDGCFEYVGRTKDSIRRRGENVSAWEVEAAALKHPQVKEAAAIGVPSPVGDEDVALLVVASGAPPAPADLRAKMAEDLPKFALPRYVEYVESLPKTPSERIAKGLVRERGISANAWDAEKTLPAIV